MPAGSPLLWSTIAALTFARWRSSEYSENPSEITVPAIPTRSCSRSELNAPSARAMDPMVPTRLIRVFWRTVVSMVPSPLFWVSSF